MCLVTTETRETRTGGWQTEVVTGKGKQECKLSSHKCDEYYCLLRFPSELFSDIVVVQQTDTGLIVH